MDIKKMPLVDDIAESIHAVKGLLPAQIAKDLTGMEERSARLSKLSKIGIAAMGICSVVALILSGVAHYFAPSAGIAEFDVPRILLDSFSSAGQVESAAYSGSVSNVNAALSEFLDGGVLKGLLPVALMIAVAAAVVRQTLTPLITLGALAGATMLLGPILNILSPEPVHTGYSKSIQDKSPRERFEMAIRDQDSASLRGMLTGSSLATTYLKAQMAIKDETLASSMIGEAAKAIASGELGFVPNNQVAYAIERSAGVKQLSAAAKSYADPAIAKSDLFTSLSYWVGTATLIFGLPGMAVLLLHLSIQRRIRRIGRLSLVLLG